jgi:hypothetical protein
VTVVPVVPVVSVAVVSAVLVTVDWDVAVDGSVVLSVVNNCHSDYRSNRKYHRAIHSYISINGDKYCRNNTHCNYWHHWHDRHNSYSDHWNNGKYHRAIHSYSSIKRASGSCSCCAYHR